MIICIGVGFGDYFYLMMCGVELICNVDVVVGFNVVVDVVKDFIFVSVQVVLMGYCDQVVKFDEVVVLYYVGKCCVVVFMGDIYFSGFQYLECVECVCGYCVEILLGIFLVQIFVFRVWVCFDEMIFIIFYWCGDLEFFKCYLVNVLNDGCNVIVIFCLWDVVCFFMLCYIVIYLL